MADEALDRRKIIGRVVTVNRGPHSSRQGTIVWADNSQVCLQTATGMITVDVAQLDINMV